MSDLYNLSEEFKVQKEEVRQAIEERGKIVLPATNSFLDYDELVNNIQNGSQFEGLLAKYLDVVTIPHTIDTLGSYALANMNNMTSLIIPENIKNINLYAIPYCYNLSTVTIKSNINYLPAGCFYNDSNLYTTYLEDSIETIGEYCFSYCNRLMNIYVRKPDDTYEHNILNKLSYIGYRAFYACTNLRELKLPNVNTIDQEAFRNCTYLNTVVLGNKITYIAANAFKACNNLTLYIDKNEEEFPFNESWGIDYSRVVYRPTKEEALDQIFNRIDAFVDTWSCTYVIDRLVTTNTDMGNGTTNLPILMNIPSLSMMLSTNEEALSLYLSYSGSNGTGFSSSNLLVTNEVPCEITIEIAVNGTLSCNASNSGYNGGRFYFEVNNFKNRINTSDFATFKTKLLNELVTANQVNLLTNNELVVYHLKEVGFKKNKEWFSKYTI